MKKGVILLEDTSKSPTEGQTLCRTMDYSCVGPGGFLFAVYFTPGGPGVFTSCSSQDILATPCAFRGAMETGVFSFSGNVGLEICWLDQAWANAVESGNGGG